MTVCLQIFSILGLLLVLVAIPTSGASVLSCSFPDSFLSFSVYRHDISLNATEEVSPETTGLSFNGQYSEQHGLTYSTDAEGSIRIRTTTTNLSITSGASMNDHARWCPIQKRLLFVSTREKNPVDNEGWSAVYMSTWDANSQSLSSPVRLTPLNVSDYSPAWGPHVVTDAGKEALVAVATGSGRPGGSDIALMRITESGLVSERTIVVKNGGWPTFLSVNNGSNPQLLFHRQTGSDLDEWSIFVVDLATGDETLLVQNGLTPSVSDSVTFETSAAPVVAFAFIDPIHGHRQIALYNFSTGRVAHITHDATHHYNPFYDARRNAVYFHKCRGGSFPNIRRRVSEDSALDIAFVSGDFPSMSPDGQHVATIFANFDYFLSVDLFQADGNSRRTIYNATHAWMTSWFNDTIAFTSGPAFSSSRDASVQVSTLHVPTNVVKQLTFSASFNQGYPCFSPDGSKIVYRTSDVFLGNPDESPELPGPYHLRIMWSGNGSVVEELRSGDLTPPIRAGDASIMGDTHPHWGPDFIVFASDRGHPGQPTIWRVYPNGTGLVEIFNRNANSVHPTTTPDGRIVFSSTIAGHSMEEVAWPYTFFPRAELFVMNNDGTELTRLTHDASNQANAFAGPQTLPPALSQNGLPTSCYYRDSTNPAPVSTLLDEKYPKSGASCPFKQPPTVVGVAGDDHAIVRKHGVTGVIESPLERHAASGCPFHHHREV